MVRKIGLNYFLKGDHMKKLLLGGFLTITALLSGCTTVVYYDDYGYTGWYNTYGNQCGSLRPGCNYWSDGLKIVDVEDPYYYSSYSWNQYYSFYYGQTVWESPSGLIYNQWGNCLNKAGQANVQRDLISVVSDAEQLTIQGAASDLAKKYSLSAETSMKVARTFNDWAKLGFTRGTKGRTAADLADFTKRLYGVDIKKVGNAMMSATLGDNTALNSTINEVASNWNTNPETMKEILKDFHSKQLEAAGIEL